MSEQNTVFNLQRVYLKDCSLELPHAPSIFVDGTEPRLEFEIDTGDEELGHDLVEVSVRCTVTCRLGDRIGFLVEATQAAIFEIQGVSDEQRMLLKGISCPHIIYPYLRANLADLVQRSSFPPVHLAEINWEAFFQQRMSEQNPGLADHAAGDSGSGIILPQ
ncbi:MAG: protein-export chaperone SecB [Betaproteobacteria bacterium]|nr:protein-export chaperone SecB [Betaproteobacteria bacterium]NBT75361.1 protein-export chaperone SecB [Betaproteobacteria bacterium]NBY13304.1 protein-export chaperone SecB [Betaproteobacteria bacterium]NCA16840.1 protein-export chaperone SecB [Betaproteobacteria bacterium]NDF04682.1 protein-export chaperone SecB [Betaproteobacteria bacterium]